MLTPKRAAPLLSIAAFTITLLYLHSKDPAPSWRRLSPTPKTGGFITEEKLVLSDPSQDETMRVPAWDSKPRFHPGTPKPHSSNYTRALVMARMLAEDVTWIEQEALKVIPAIYVVDDLAANLRPPKNKGHEVMVYLTYIIEYYDALPDINIFMHAHRWSWHNNELLNNDAVEMIRRLSSERVTREGYMNMRCHWNPGCPDWIHPGVVEGDMNKLEENHMVQCWAELFPGEAVPTKLAQPCCAQFAVSRERIRSVDLERWIFYREWLLKTDLTDHLSGRIWEYLWQVVLSGESFMCKNQHECYCDGYGVCFIDERDFDDWFEVKAAKTVAEDELTRWIERMRTYENVVSEGRPELMSLIEAPQQGKGAELRARIEELTLELEGKRNNAVSRGTDPRIRAQIAGRVWRDGDGF